jgi:hypothetical protein
MAWTDVRPVLVRIVEETILTTRVGQLRASLKYFPAASRENLPPDRGFFFPLPTRMAQRGELTLDLPARFTWDLALVIAYSLKMNYEQLLDVIAADHKALAARLPDSNIWEQATSGIDALYMGRDEITDASIEAVDGRALVSFPFSLDFTT